MKKKRTLIGMVSLPPLPGTISYSGSSIDEIISFAVREAKLLDQAGFDGVMVQNVNDVPSRNHVFPETLTYMTRICSEIRKNINPESLLGVSILKNEGAGAVAVAVATNADFIRLKVYVGAMLSAEGITTGCYEDVLETKHRLGSKVKIWTDVHDRTGVPLGQQSLDEAVEHSVKVGKADVVILTGKTFSQSLQWIHDIKKAKPQVQVYIGGGVTPDNLENVFEVADGAIVGTCLKRDGQISAPIDSQRLGKFMACYVKNGEEIR